MAIGPRAAEGPRTTQRRDAVLELAGSGRAVAHAQRLLADLGVRSRVVTGPPDPHPDLDWARSGAMSLCGRADGPPRVAPGAPCIALRGAAAGLCAVARAWGHEHGKALEGLDAPALLGERAALLGLARRHDAAPGGKARLLRAADGWVCLNLARPEDLDLLPAWLEVPVSADGWPSVEEALRERSAAPLVARGRRLGLAVALAGTPPTRPPAWCRVTEIGERRAPPTSARPLVIDLSSLWAGPLATGLLAAAGARVVKLESSGRPDAARAGSSEFFDLLNAHKESVVLDFGSASDRRVLARLLEAADVVVESARPRALSQLGLDAAAWLSRRPGRTWLSITGYGRGLPWGGWVAFGDDAAAAAGWCHPDPEAPGPFFRGDALADPMAGLHAALAALTAWWSGGGRLLDVALRDVAAHVRGRGEGSGTPARDAARVVSTRDGWALRCAGEQVAVAPPRARVPTGRAARWGSDTDSCLSELCGPC